MQTKFRLNILMGVLFFLLFVAVPAGSGTVARGKVQNKEGTVEAHRKLPLYFIENKGQLDPRVRFYVKRSGQTVYFTDEKIVFDFLRGEAGAVRDTEGAKKERLVFNLGKASR